MKVQIEFVARLDAQGGTGREKLSSLVDRLTEELIERGAQDAFVGADLDGRLIEIQISVDAADEIHAFESAMALISGAIQATTPGDEKRWSVERIGKAARASLR